MKRKINTVALLSLFLLILTIVPTNRVEAQDPTPMSLTATPSIESHSTSTPMATLTPSFEQRLELLEEKIKYERLETVEEQVQGLINQPEVSNYSATYSVLNNVIVNCGIPIAVMIILGYFRGSIKNIMEKVGNNISNVRIKIGEFEWEASELNDIITEREILKLCILMATIDDDYDPAEFKLLRDKTADMVSNITLLSDRNKEKVLQVGIQMAIADEVLKTEEYDELKKTANLLGIADLDSIILRYVSEFPNRNIQIDIDELKRKL